VSVECIYGLDFLFEPFVPEIWDAVYDFEPFLSFFLHHGPRDGVCVDVFEKIVGVVKSLFAKGALHFLYILGSFYTRAFKNEYGDRDRVVVL
jgi:hypothetical protein